MLLGKLFLILGIHDIVFYVLQQQSREQKQRRTENVRAAGARFRQKLNQDPERREVYLQKKRDYYHASKNNTVLSQNEIDRERQYKTQQKRDWRSRQKAIPAVQIPFKKPKVVPKKVKKCYQQLKKKNEENTKLQQTVYNLNRKVKFWKEKASGGEQQLQDPITSEIEGLLEDPVGNLDIIRKKLVKLQFFVEIFLISVPLIFCNNFEFF